MYPHWKSSFVLLWTGQAFSILTSSISQYALLWYLAGTTGSAAILSLATIFIMLPQGVLSLFTGSFADRYDRRCIMALSDGAIGLVSLALAACLIGVGFLPPSGFWLFVLLSFLMAPCAPFFNGPSLALIQEKVEPEYLGRVLGISGAIMSLASPLGLLVTTFWGDLLPLPMWFLLSGLVILLCGLLCIALPSVRNCDSHP